MRRRISVRVTPSSLFLACRSLGNTLGSSPPFVTSTTSTTTTTTSSSTLKSFASVTSARDALALASVASSATSLIQATASISSGIDESIIRNCSTWDVLADTVKTLQATRKPWGVNLIVSVLERASALSTISSSSSSYSASIFDRIIKPAVTKEFDRGDAFVRSMNNATTSNRSFSPPGSLVAVLPNDFVRIVDALDTLAKNGVIVNTNDGIPSLYKAINGAFNRGIVKMPGSLRNVRSRALIRLLESGDRLEIMSRRGFTYKGEESIWDSIAHVAENRLSELLNGTLLNNEKHLSEDALTHSTFCWLSNANQRLAFESIAAELTTRLSATTSSGLYSRTSWKASHLGSICSSSLSTLIGALQSEKILKSRSSPIDDEQQLSEIQKVKESALALLYAALDRASSDGGLLRAARSMQSYWAGKATLSSADSQGGAQGGGSSSSGSDTENKSRVIPKAPLKIRSDGVYTSSSPSSPAVHSPDHAPASFADVWIRQILNAVSVVAILRIEKFPAIAEAAFLAVAACCSVQNAGALSTGLYAMRHVEAARASSRDPNTIDWLAVQAIEPGIAARRSNRWTNPSDDIDGVNDDSTGGVHPKFITLARTFRTSPELLGSFLFASRSLQSLNNNVTRDTLFATSTCSNDFLKVIENSARILNPSCPPSYYITDASSSSMGGGKWSNQRSASALMAITEALALVSSSSSLTSDGLEPKTDSRGSQTFAPTSAESSGIQTTCRMIALSALAPAPPAGSVHNKSVEDDVQSTTATSSLEHATALLSSALSAGISSRLPVPKAIDPHEYSRAVLLSIRAAESGEAKMEELLVSSPSVSTAAFRPFVTVAATRIHRRLESLYSVVVDDSNDNPTPSNNVLSSKASLNLTSIPVEVEAEEPDLVRRARVLRSKISLKHTGSKHRTFSTLVQKIARGGGGGAFGGRIVLPSLSKDTIRRSTSLQSISPAAISSLFCAVSCLLVQAHGDVLRGNLLSASTCLMQSDLILAKWKRRVAPQSQTVRGGLKASAFETPLDTNLSHLAPSYPHLTLLAHDRDIMSHEATIDSLISIFSTKKLNLNGDNEQGGPIASSPGMNVRFIEFGAALLTRVCLKIPPLTIQNGLTVELERDLSLASRLFAALLESESTCEHSFSAQESLAYASTIFSDLIRRQGRGGGGEEEWKAQSGIYLPLTLAQGLRGIIDGGEKFLFRIESKQGGWEMEKEKRMVDAVEGLIREVKGYL